MILSGCYEAYIVGLGSPLCTTHIIHHIHSFHQGAAKEYVRDKDIRDVAQTAAASNGPDNTYKDILKER